MSAVSAQNAAIATLSYSRFKNRWLSCIGLESAQILSLFKKAVAAESNCVEAFEKDLFDDYFDFAMESQSAACGDSCTIDTVVSKYFSDSTREVSMLKCYPAIKKSVYAL